MTLASGHVIKRGDAYRIVVDAGADPITGKRRQLTRTVHGTKREAEAVATRCSWRSPMAG